MNIGPIVHRLCHKLELSSFQFRSEPQTTEPITSQRSASSAQNVMSTTMNTATTSLADRRRPDRRLSRCTELMILLILIYTSQIDQWTTTITAQSFQTNAGAGQQRVSQAKEARQPEPVRPIYPSQAMAEGPGIDLVAFNRRRFELDHHHEDQRDGGAGSSLDQQLRRAQSIEADLAALSNRLIAVAPNDMAKQFLDSVNVDPSSAIGVTSAGQLTQSSSSDADSSSMDDPDGASIARLTKSCLTVHASSARPDQLDVKFYLYTKSNPLKAHLLTPQVSRLELLKGSPFDPSKPIKWITHGFHTNVDKSEWMVEAKDKILQFEDANVFLTDWRRGASPALAFYPKAAANAHVVAKFIVRILRRLKDDIDLSQVHLIGHSLGAHIMGFVGSAFTEEHLMRQQQLISMPGNGAAQSSLLWRTQEQPSKLLIGRITACDPALPCFGPSSSGPIKEPVSQPGPVAIYRTQDEIRQQKSISDSSSSAAAASRDGSMLVDGADWTPSMWTHLRPDSAITVEVMHTNPGFMGYAEPLGDFDFYPNGFERQPGCGKEQQDQSRSGKSPQSDVATINQATPFRRMKRQWAAGLLDGIMTTLVHPLVSNTSRWQPTSMVANTNNKNSQNLAAVAQQQVSSARAEASRFSQTIDRLLNPIRSFFKGNTCSHHRSVEYMVESLYYDRVPQDRKLDRDLVCQMVGYRCPDYESFKKGFCFRCLNGELDCRAFGMSLIASSDELSSSLPPPLRVSPAQPGVQVATAPHHQLGGHLRSGLVAESATLSQGRQLNLLNRLEGQKFRQRSPLLNGKTPPLLESTTTALAATNETKLVQKPPPWLTVDRLNSTARRIVKRVLPTFDQYTQNYQPQNRNQYFFDTRPSKSFCLHHYHIHVKYRWFRVRESILLDGFRLLGTLANLSRKSPIQLHKFTHNSYTALLSEPLFLGQIESLIIFGARVKPTLIEYIEVTFMSNLDPKVRALGSAKLCRAPSLGPSGASYYTRQQQQATNDQIGDQLDNSSGQPPVDSLFVRCSGSMVR